MEPGTGRLGMKIFLALLHKKPVKPLVTPQQYQALLKMDPTPPSAPSRNHSNPPERMEMDPTHRSAASCSHSKPPERAEMDKVRPSLASCSHSKSPERVEMDGACPAATSCSYSKPPKNTNSCPAAAKNKQNPKPGRVVLAPPEPQALPPGCRDFLVNKGVALDDGNLKLIFVRRLFTTDTNPHHARLSIPYKQVKEVFLTPGEELILRQGNNIEVEVIDPSLRQQTMCLARWNIGNGWCYALIRDWKNLVQGNLLVEGDVIQVWSFRIDGKLGFLIHKTASSPANGSAGFGCIGVASDHS